MISASNFFKREPSELRKRKRAGFSLVEVVMAVGIVGSVFAALIGLMASGLQVFQQSTDRVVSAQISQRLINELGQTEWKELFDVDQERTATFPVRYFTRSGEEVSAAGEAVYLARPVVFAPGSGASPAVGGVDYSTLGEPRFVRVVVEVLHRPSGVVPATGSSGLWQSGQNDRLRRLSALVVKNR
jgi:uncharacterized protein (TIGR02598 family)